MSELYNEDYHSTELKAAAHQLTEMKMGFASQSERAFQNAIPTPQRDSQTPMRMNSPLYQRPPMSSPPQHTMDLSMAASSSIQNFPASLMLNERLRHGVTQQQNIFSLEDILTPQLFAGATTSAATGRETNRGQGSSYPLPVSYLSSCAYNPTNGANEPGLDSGTNRNQRSESSATNNDFNALLAAHDLRQLSSDNAGGIVTTLSMASPPRPAGGVSSDDKDPEAMMQRLVEEGRLHPTKRHRTSTATRTSSIGASRSSAADQVDNVAAILAAASSCGLNLSMGSGSSAGASVRVKDEQTDVEKTELVPLSGPASRRMEDLYAFYTATMQRAAAMAAANCVAGTGSALQQEDTKGFSATDLGIGIEGTGRTSSSEMAEGGSLLDAHAAQVNIFDSLYLHKYNMYRI